MSFPLQPLRDAVLRSPVGYNDIARDLEWYRRKKRCGAGYRTVPDGSRVARAIGATTYMSHGRSYRNTTIDFELAAKIVRSIGLDPVDIGL